MNTGLFYLGIILKILYQITGMCTQMQPLPLAANLKYSNRTIRTLLTLCHIIHRCTAFLLNVALNESVNSQPGREAMHQQFCVCQRKIAQDATTN